MKKAYILLHGNLSQIPILKNLLTDDDVLICADGGAEYAYDQGIVPDAIVGDLDSISSKVLTHFKKKQVLLRKYPKGKNCTDAELAITFGIEQNAQELVIIGLLGNRIDHMLSNIYHIASISTTIPSTFIEGDIKMHIIMKHLELCGKKGDELSLIPLKGHCKGISTQGLYYPLHKETLPFGSTRGISNVFLGKIAMIHVESGVLLACHRSTA